MENDHACTKLRANSLKLQVTGMDATQVGTNNCTETWLGPGICDLRLAANHYIVQNVRQDSSV